MLPSDNDFESQFSFETNAEPLADEPPFHILFLGNWSGSRNLTPLYDRRPIIIDRDNFDSVIQRLEVNLEIDLYNDSESVIPLHFTEFEDFHPDNLYRQVPIFSELRELRRKLLDPDSFDQAAYGVRSWFGLEEANEFQIEVESDIDDSPSIESVNLLDAILAKPSASTTSKRDNRQDNSELGRFVSKIVSSHIIKIDENEQSKLIAAVDEAVTGLMRNIIHHRDFQDLESAWRGLYFLTRKIETNSSLKIFILDVGKDDLIDDLRSQNSLTDTFLYKTLFENNIKNSFSVLGGNYSFNVNVDDIAALIRISKIAEAADSPFISHVYPQLFGLNNFEGFAETSLKLTTDPNLIKLWTALQSSSETDFLGLSPMKFLGRLPFGESTDSIETFSFEEFKEKYQHNNLLWVNPSFLCIYLLAKTFQQTGWDLSMNFYHEIENSLTFYFEKDGETKSKSSSEIYLTENMLEKLMENGLIPLIFFKDKTKIMVPRLESVSGNGFLKGKWN